MRRIVIPDIVIPVDCDEVLVYVMGGASGTGTYFAGRVQLARTGYQYIQTTDTQIIGE